MSCREEEQLMSYGIWVTTMTNMSGKRIFVVPKR